MQAPVDCQTSYLVAASSCMDIAMRMRHQGSCLQVPVDRQISYSVASNLYTEINMGV